MDYMTVVSPLRVGIVGLGGIGHLHAESVRTLSHELVGGVDVSDVARSRFQDRFGVATFSSYQDLFEAGVDAIFVATPNRFHEEHAVAALKTDVSVLVEKPLAHTLSSAERIVSAAERSRALCTVGFNERYSNGVNVIMSHQSDGFFGDIYHVDAHYIRRRGIPGIGSWFTESDIAGGGALLDIGVHTIDLALYFLGFPPVREVIGTTRSDFGPDPDYTYLEMWGDERRAGTFNVEDSAFGFIRCTGDKSVCLNVAWAANQRNNDVFRIYGTEAGAEYDRGSEEVTLFEVSSGGSSHYIDSKVTAHRSETHRRQDRAFLRAVTTGDSSGLVLMEEALTVQRAIDAIYRSRDVDLPARTSQ